MGVWQMHAFPKLLCTFQGPSQFAALLPQSDKAFQYHNEYRMLRSFVRRPSLYSESRFFLPRLSRPPGDMPSKFSLLFTWHITNVQNDIFTTKYTLVSAIIIPVTLAPPTGFHASKRQDITRVFGLKILLLNVPDCRFISNQPFQL